MNQLIELAEDYRSLLREELYPLSKDCRGALLEVDRLWLDAYLRHVLPSYSLEAELWNSDASRLLQIASTIDELKWDFEFRPAGWSSHCKSMGYPPDGSPIVIRVVLKSPPQSEPESFRSRSFRGHPLIFEFRPPVVAAATVLSRLADWMKGAEGSRPRDRAAQSVGSSAPRTAGTLGGYLRGIGSGSSYLVSCQHVIGPAGTPVLRPGPAEGRDSDEVAVVSFSDLPLPNPPGSECNLFAAPMAGRLDFAMAEILTGAIPSQLQPEKTVDGVRHPARMSPYQRVWFQGKESGRVDAQLTAVTIWHEILFPDGHGGHTAHCFGTLFEMSDPSGNGSLARQGDSGAWVIDENQGLRLWNGILIARLGSRAYGCYASFALDACNSIIPGGVALY